MGGGGHWYKNSVVYAVDVKRFDDSDGDGVGDFQGLTDRLNYLSRLGVDCLWLLPFYPSPDRDNGYDVADYYGVDDRLGTLGEFTTFLREAEGRGIRVLVDLVVNHTSDQHPWFQQARRNPDSKYRDYYVWSEDPPETDEQPVVSTSTDSVWTYDDVADAYYFHRYYPFQPGLNLSNPDVRSEIRDIMGYWLRLGVDGFRLDAAASMTKAKGLESAKPDDPYGMLHNFREFARTHRSDAVLLGEVDENPDQLDDFFGDGERFNMLFNFLLDNYLFLAFARESAEPVVEGLRLLPSIPSEGQWVNFLRNLDELDLGRLTDSERADVFEQFAPDEDMRIFGRGIRRRLAPMLAGIAASEGDDAGDGDERSGNRSGRDERRLRLAFSLLFSLPGTPLVVYGDEIGMGDDLTLSGRSAVRTPMQWSTAENGGFSNAPADDLVAPVIDDGPFGYERVNVADQQFDPGSLFNWLQRLVHLRKENVELGWGEFDVVETEQRDALVHRCSWGETGVVAVHNLTDDPVEVSFELDDDPRLVDVFADRQYEAFDGTPYEFTAEPYGYRWLRVGDAIDASSRGWEDASP